MLSPIEIKKQEFGRSVRGYDVSEVRTFLESVAAELERIAEIARARETEIHQLKSELETFKRIEQNMKEALVNAQETLREAREGSRREADLKLREAAVEAERIVRDAYKQRDAVMREVEALIARRDAFVRKLRGLMRSELELVELLEEQDISIDDADKRRASGARPTGRAQRTDPDRG